MLPWYRAKLLRWSHWKKNSIAYRLTFQVVLFSTLVALLSTAVQLYFDYRHDVRDIKTFFVSIEETSLPPLEESVWILDELQVNLQLEGLTRRQDIVYAAVEMDGQMAWGKGTPVQRNSIARIYPLFHNIRGASEQIGRLHVVASLDGIYQRLLNRIVIILASNAVKTFLVSGFILLIFQKNITQHLTKLAEDVQHIDIRHHTPQLLRLDREPSLRSDELDLVTTALNVLCQSGYRAYLDSRTQEQRLRLFFDATDDAIFGVDPQGRCTFINRSGLDHFAIHDEGQLVDRNILDMLAQKSRMMQFPCALSDQVRTTIREKKILLTDEMPFFWANESAQLVSLRSYPVVEAEQCTGAIVFFADISRQQKLEQEKQLFTKVVRQAPALILIADAQSTVEYVNTSFVQTMGYGSDQMVGKKVFYCFEQLQMPEQMKQVEQVIDSGQTWTGTFTSANAQGSCVNLEAIIFPIFTPQGQLTNVVVMGQDVTREMLLTEQLYNAQKMEAIGKLAASVAHEFGNPLLGIRFALRDVQQRPGINAEDKHLLQLAENECDRMRQLIRDMQQFNRPSTGKKISFDLHRILEQIVMLHQNFLAKKKVSVIRQYGRQPLHLYAVEDQIRQVFVNLIINASDALAAQGGALTIGTTVENDKVVVTVADNGPGISPENIPRIFEPFFTTKPTVEGTGLGLPVSYGIVRAHGGTIEVRSVPGNTVFIVALPVEAPGGREETAAPACLS
jgi:PAS domain S-box-containing protein